MPDEEEQVFIVAKQKDDMDSTDCPYTQKYNVLWNYIHKGNVSIVIPRLIDT